MTVVLAAGMLMVVVAALRFATVAPVQPENEKPEAGALAMIVTVAPARYDPVVLPFEIVPFTTVKVYVGGPDTGTVIVLLKVPELLTEIATEAVPGPI